MTVFYLSLALAAAILAIVEPKLSTQIIITALIVAGLVYLMRLADRQS